MPTPDNYSIEMVFNIASITGTVRNGGAGNGWVNLIEFKDRTSDQGFYNFNGFVQFYNVTTSTGTVFAPGVDVHVVITARPPASSLSLTSTASRKSVSSTAATWRPSQARGTSSISSSMT